MRKTKKLSVLILAVVMVLSLNTTTAIAAETADVSSGYRTSPNEVEGWEFLGEKYKDQKGLVYNPAWFRALRCAYPFYETHYTTNWNMEGLSMGYIVNQASCPDFLIGTKHMSGVGCEIAATYNALKLRGRRIPCSSIIRTFEKDGFLMGGLTCGDLGSDPYAIGEYLTDNSISHTKYTNYNTMKTAVGNNAGSAFNVYIVSFWNSDNITGGLHTVAFYTSASDGYIHVYNLHSYSTSVETESSFASFVASNRFIVGYNIPRLRTINW